MKIQQIAYRVACPYCGHKQIRPLNSTSEVQHKLTYCGDVNSGCDQPFVIEHHLNPPVLKALKIETYDTFAACTATPT